MIFLWPLLAVTLLQAQENPEIEAKLAALPEPVLAIDTSLDAYHFKSHGGHGDMEIIDVAGMPFDKAFRVRSFDKVQDQEYLVQLGTDNTVPVKEGDVMMATFYARVVETQDESGEGTISFMMRPNTPPWTGSEALEAGFGPEWKKFYHPFRVVLHNNDPIDEPGESEAVFSIGYHIQTVDIADLKVFKYPEGVPFADLPGSSATYEGRELDAPWRQAAAERIEKYRKGDLEIVVTGPDGQPLADVPVEVKMRQHAFPFTSAINAIYMEQTFDLPVGERYREEYAKRFTKASHISALKWTLWLKDRQLAIDNVDWLLANDIEVRGHNLVWPRFDRTPWAKDKKMQQYYRQHPEELQEQLLNHIRDMTTTFKGKIKEYDLYNEPYSHYEFVDIIGSQAVAEWFQVAHEVDPELVLYINEANKMTRPDINNDSHRYLQKLVRGLQEAGAPIGGIGFESHFRWGCPNPQDVYNALDYYWTEFQLPLQITEFDHRIADLQLQADWQRDYMTVCFSHPAVVGFVQWGFWNGISKGGYLKPDWRELPNGKVYNDLVYHLWWTDEKVNTDADGKADVRGFLGQYDVVIDYDGKQWVYPVDLAKDGTVLTAHLTDEERQRLGSEKKKKTEAKQAAVAAAEATIRQHIAEKRSGLAGLPDNSTGKSRLNVGNPKSGIALHPDGQSGEGADLSYATWLPEGDQEKMLMFHQDLVPGEWRHFSFTFTPEADGKLPLLIQTEFRKENETPVWAIYDDIEVLGASLVNGSFEEGTKTAPDAWKVKKSQTPARYITGSDQARSGDKAMLVTFFGGIIQDIEVKKGQPVTISGWAKLPKT